jgi:hypothetical protein
MSLLNNFPHLCTIRRRIRAKGPLGGSVDTFLNEQTSVSCWEQHATAKEISDFEKRGMLITSKIFFTANPSVGERHQIIITERNGTAISSDDQIPLDVRTEANPDASAGLGVVWKVMCTENTGEDD